MGQRWYVVQTKSNQEDVVVYHLRNQKFDCFLPKMKITKRVRGEVVSVGIPLFPSYLFVRFDVEQESWRSINGTRGVVKLLGTKEDSASPVQVGFVEDLLEKTDRNGVVSAERAGQVVKTLCKGDTILVTDGIFKGFSGTCASVQKSMAVVLLTLLSGKVGVRLPLNTLEVA